MAIRRSRAQWLEVLSEFEASGETLARFCARRGLSAGTFGWWRWRLRDEGRGPATRNEVRLVAVDVQPPAVRVVGGGVTARLYGPRDDGNTP